MQLKPHEDLEHIPHIAPPPHKRSHAGFLILLFVAGLALAAAVVYELGKRKTETQTLASNVVETASGPPVVNVGLVRRAPAQSEMEFPCQTQAMVETPVYARADGYITKRPHDIGDRVKKGDLLFEIETPELDQQIEQAKAALAQSKAALQQYEANLAASQSSLKLAEVTAKRWKTLADKGVFARQDLDEKMAALELGQANVKSAEENVHAAEGTVAAADANLKRLQDLKSFDRLTAPFDGMVTYRNTQADVGTLVTSGNTASSRELMRIAQLGDLRVYVSIAQTYAPLIHAGLPAEVVVDELPGRVVHTKVDSITHSVDASSRTMLALLFVKNEHETLLPGMYAKVRFSLPHAVNALMLPADALMLPKEGPEAAVVDENHKVHIQRVTLGRDYGAQVEILSGLNEGDMVVLSPNDSVREGVTVEPKQPK
jgi:RND family efflux transporter MFP subunit